MVEIGFSTVFEPERQRPPHRLGFFGRRLHWLYTRAGRLKILRAERLASQSTAEIAAREKALVEKEAELQTAREAITSATAKHEAQLKRQQRSSGNLEEQGSRMGRQAGCHGRFAQPHGRGEGLPARTAESEVERQIQLRQNAWSERLAQSRQELDDQRAATKRSARP